MKILLVYFLFLFSNQVFAQNKIELRGSKLFFLDKNFGALLKNDQTIAITSDGAQTWKNITIETEERLQKILFTSELNGWLIGDSSIFKTSNGGLSWTKNHTFVESNQLFTIYFLDNQNGFVGSQSSELYEYEQSIYFTLNGGQSWETSPIDTFSQGAIHDFSFFGNSIGMAVGSFGIYKTINGGLNWKALPIKWYVGTGGPVSIKIIDSDNIILVTWAPYVVAEGDLFYSVDGGTNWSKYGNGQHFKWGINDNYFLNMDSVWLSTNDYIYITENGGYNWDTLNISIKQFSFISNTEAYGLSGDNLFYTDDGWRTYSVVDSNVTRIEKIILSPESIILDQNYPNPFNPFTKISYSIPDLGSSNDLTIKLKVYDITGREIRTLVSKYQNPGNYEFQFDGSNLASGLYFYRLQIGNFSQVRKMILLK